MAKVALINNRWYVIQPCGKAEMYHNHASAREMAKIQNKRILNKSQG